MGLVVLPGRDLLSISDFAPGELTALLARAMEMKAGADVRSLQGKRIALLFEKPSLRTRVSFEVAMQQLGGSGLYLGPQEVGLGVREPVSDVAGVLCRWVDAIVCRTFHHRNLEELSLHSTVPVINALSDDEHPCQALADLLTILEYKKQFDNLVFAFVGDGNNVATSLALGAASVGVEFRIATPPGYELSEGVTLAAQELAKHTGGSLHLLMDPKEAVRGADVVYTDVWTSMGQESEMEVRREAFDGYQVNQALLRLAAPDAIFLHPMPAHYGEEVPHGFLNHPQSVTFDQAENRMHVQKALLEAILTR